MADEVGTKITSPEAPGAPDSLFDDAADDPPTSIIEVNGSEVERVAGQQGAGDAEKQVPSNKAVQDPQGSADGGTDIAPSDDLKVVVSVKGTRATIGVQRPSADPHIETFEDHDLPGLAQAVPAVTERARARWVEAPRHPAYQRPAPPAKRRNRRQQGTAQDSTTPDSETEQAQQQTLQLF